MINLLYFFPEYLFQSLGKTFRYLQNFGSALSCHELHALAVCHMHCAVGATCDVAPPRRIRSVGVFCGALSSPALALVVMVLKMAAVAALWGACGFVRKLGNLPSISGISGPWALGKMTINDDSPMDFEGPPCSNKPPKTEGTQGGSYWDDLEILRCAVTSYTNLRDHPSAFSNLISLISISMCIMTCMCVYIYIIVSVSCLSLSETEVSLHILFRHQQKNTISHKGSSDPANFPGDNKSICTTFRRSSAMMGPGGVPPAPSSLRKL